MTKVLFMVAVLAYESKQILGQKKKRMQKPNPPIAEATL
jgi:hypothetical protein